MRNGCYMSRTELPISVSRCCQGWLSTLSALQVTQPFEDPIDLLSFSGRHAHAATHLVGGGCFGDMLPALRPDGLVTPLAQLFAELLARLESHTSARLEGEGFACGGITPGRCASSIP